MENSMKRTRDEFEEVDSRGGQYEGSGFNNFEAKRQHIDPAQELTNNICKDIRRLGETGDVENLVADTNYITNPIVAEFEKMDTLRNAILPTIYALITEQPHKISAISNLVLICNAKNFVVAKYVIEYLHSKVQSLLDSKKGSPFNHIKNILKFLSTLTPIIEDYGIIQIYKQFLNFAIDLQKDKEARDGVAQEIYYNVLIAIPYLLSNDKSDEMKNHVNDLVELATTFKIVYQPASVLFPFDARFNNFELPYVPRQMVDLILPALLSLQKQEWNFELFLDFKPFLDPVIESSLANNSISSELIKHKLPQFSLPTLDKESFQLDSIDKLWQDNPRYLFQVYNNTTSYETVPPIESYYGLFFKDIAFDILTNLSFNKNETAIELSILDMFFNQKLFAPPGTSIDQLNEIEKDNELGANDPRLSTWKIEDVAVESILTMIFQLPAPLEVEMYYYSVLISCCRESPESIAPVFGRAIRFLYNHLESLDYELKLRFLDWMSIQLSNFEFSWKWEEWVEDSKKYKDLKFHPKKNFIKNLIAKEIRLSNKKRIKDSFVDVVEDQVVNLDEFYQYLDISMVPDVKEYILEYDTALYGGSEDKLKELFERKQELLAAKSTLTAQDEIFFNFTNSELPFHETGSKVYDFILTHWKSNSDFNDLYKSVLEEVDAPNRERFAINLIFQTYAYIGSRSIYSVVSILSRDINKLKFLSGATIDYVGEEAQFEDLHLTEDQKQERQVWIIDAIFRIWIHRPQVVFLILEYLIEFGIVNPKYLLQKALESNLIIDNVSCMESINRVLANSKLKDLILQLSSGIISNLNKLEHPTDKPVAIEEIAETNAAEVDKQWLFYEYLGLLKSYFRKYISQDVDYADEIKEIFTQLENVPAREEVLSWFN
ncbi:Nuclear cap-binding protein complex subunit 1 [Candida viswanathii]|uniref:Nuclear cap-binding protein complex subunit 1 n=1 Tax=Candida viswanathii TaxID=5486 RepID=A0A367YKL3_9ASCO|nr:Nuclear cap-binding protein complex subunit 1 [Candida viswanathii]